MSKEKEISTQPETKRAPLLRTEEAREGGRVVSASDIDVEPLVKAIQASAERLGCGSEHLELAFSIDESPVPVAWLERAIGVHVLWIAKRHDVPSSERANATRVVVRGFGGTHDEAIEDLERRLRSQYPWTVREQGGCGGYPRGRIVEIYGPEGSDKTTLTLHVIAECQKAGGVAAFVDVEHAFDVRYARALGVQPDKLIISQPDSGEQALEIVETLTRSGAIDLVVVDSVAALVPRAEIEGDMGDSHVGLQARLMSQAMRKLTAAIHQTKTCVMFINQLTRLNDLLEKALADEASAPAEPAPAKPETKT